MTDTVQGTAMPAWGAVPTGDGATRFRIWAPGQSRMSLNVASNGMNVAMSPVGDGWFELLTDAVATGEEYGYTLEDGRFVPDPASRAQNGDVHGPSRVVDHRAYDWKQASWSGRPWHESVIYELHTGTFSVEGSFDGVEAKLDHIEALGVTAIELMPVAQFSGNRGWGYDGVLLYAPHSAYGTPNDLKCLVDGAHARGLMVLLDVVYNHFGPDGNYLHAIAPEFFDPTRDTPWGAAIDYTKPAVRAFAIENALYWLEEYRFDGLRLDAINQIIDPSPTHVLVELAETVRSRLGDRQVHLTTEDDSNQTALHERDSDGHVRLYSAEWNDDFHHAAHVAATGENEGYYADYDRPPALFARSLADGFSYQGEQSQAWDGVPRGQPSAHLPPVAFIDFVQNHDQIGNRAFGERLTTLTSNAAAEALMAALVLSPQIPLLFMGEEWGETRPFLFFTDFLDDLAVAVCDGRRREFARWAAFSDPKVRETIPDPNAFETFAASRIDWRRKNDTDGGERYALVQQLLRIRNEAIVPRLANLGGHAAVRSGYVGTIAHAAWRLADSSLLALTVNLGDETEAIAQSFRADDSLEAILFARPDQADEQFANGQLAPWGIVVSLTAPNETAA